MNPFDQVNVELTHAQDELTKAIRETAKTEVELEIAEINLIKAKSSKIKARLTQKLWDEQVQTARDKGYNLRAESKLR